MSTSACPSAATSWLHHTRLLCAAGHQAPGLAAGSDRPRDRPAGASEEGSVSAAATWSGYGKEGDREGGWEVSHPHGGSVPVHKEGSKEFGVGAAGCQVRSGSWLGCALAMIAAVAACQYGSTAVRRYGSTAVRRPCHADSTDSTAPRHETQPQRCARLHRPASTVPLRTPRLIAHPPHASSRTHLHVRCAAANRHHRHHRPPPGPDSCRPRRPCACACACRPCRRPLVEAQQGGVAGHRGPCVGRAQRQQQRHQGGACSASRQWRVAAAAGAALAV
mgnify:CR=1 FL=1